MELDRRSLRSAVEQDADAVAALVNSGYRGESSRRGWTSEDHLLTGGRIHAQGVRDLLIKPGTTVLVYEQHGEILACVELAVHDRALYLGMLTVRPDLQGGGMGRFLLEAAEEFAVQQSCGKITMVVVEGRPELVAWYGRRGFHPTGEYKPFTNTDPAFGIPRNPLRFMVLEKKLR